MTLPSFMQAGLRRSAFNAVAGLVLAAAMGTSTAAVSTARAAEPAQPTDPAVRALLADISAQRIEQRIRTLAAFETRHTESETDSETRGIGAARRWIERELRDCSARSGGRLEVSTQSWEEPAGRGLTRPTTLVNVIATLPGSSAVARARVLLISGHYDSRATDLKDSRGAAPGANDDASGTAVSMELACAMASRRYEATLVFMAVPGEEQGLLGAAHYAKDARERGVDIEGMVTNDIVGSSNGDAGEHDPKRLRLFVDGFDPLLRLLPPARPGSTPNAGETAIDPETRARLQAIASAGGSQDLPTQQFGRHLKAAAEAYVPGFQVQLIQRRDRYLRGGDHLPFLESGYAAVRFTEPFENFDHQHQAPRTEGKRVYGDLVEFVDFGFVADVARANAAGLATLALAPAPPREARLDASELTNDSTLTWALADDPNVAGYRIVWRDTGSPVWQQARDVGLVGRATLPHLSKDNVVFGVEALSRSGHASLASFPLPLRR